VALSSFPAPRFLEPVYRNFGLANIMEQTGIVRRVSAYRRIGVSAYRPDALVIACIDN